MRRNIFLYLFVFSALIALFFLMRGTRAATSSAEQIGKLENDNQLLKDSVQNLQLRVLDMQYFSLENNDDALAYYDHLDLENPTRYIEDKLLETNERSGDNPLVPYEGMESSFKI
ncbi:MAG: hydrolase, partial [Bacteroidota bacterium]